ncbi:c-type cytochrome, partial [bacterium]
MSTEPQANRKKRVLRFIAVSVLFFLLTGCSAETRQWILTTFFDGADTPPPPTRRVRQDLLREIEELKRELAEARRGLAEARAGMPKEEKAPLPAEQVKSWPEAVALLPKDITGQVDWVQALKAKAIAPRPGIEPRATDQPVLPVTVERAPKAVFKAVYPHEPHTALLGCESCHPAPFQMMGGGTPISMAKIFQGELCGACHGKVAFDPMTGCPRCHVNLVHSEKETVEADLVKAQTSPIPSTPEITERGKAVYLDACAACHGEKGDGKGPLAAFLDPKPRDFTAGKFKFRSTPSSSLPTDLDLFRTITQGPFGTSMPGFSRISYEERRTLVQFIKTFSDKFSKEKPAQPILIPDPPPRTAELIEKGRELYKDAGCNSCHGDTGKGDGPSARELKDDWGNPISPFDFTSGKPLKGGSTPKDIYRAIMTGLQGTPMPDFGDAFEKEQAWAVVYYILSLSDEKGGSNLGVKGDIVFQREARQGDVPPAVFPHWFHRIRFKCYACHPSIFQMKAGANAITMD